MDENTSLEDISFLIIDCQTTGMRPSSGKLLEIAWAQASASLESVAITSRLITLPEGTWFPPRVQEITGLKESDLKDAHAIDSVRSEFQSAITAAPRPLTALIHYSQFEEPFLKSFMFSDEAPASALPFEILCTHRLAKKLYPTVPSRNIRGLTGFFGSRIGEIKRAHQHVHATHLIWKGIVAALREQGVTTLAQVREFLKEPLKSSSRKSPGAKVKSLSYEYRVDRAKRLALPDRPGIYKMKDKDGAVLYVGKATSLKSRVNSYFRGKKGRDARKLEMMAQVWDVEVIECGSTIEAALAESDTIKEIDPPYNVSLKNNRRSLMFYSHDFGSDAAEPDAAHSIGPFRRYNSVDVLRTMLRGLDEGVVLNVFHRPIADEVLNAGYELFCIQHPELNLESRDLRVHLANGLVLLRKAKAAGAGSESESESETNADVESGIELGDEIELQDDLTADDVALKFEALYSHAASSYLRSKLMTQLLWSDVSWVEKSESRSLKVRGGRIAVEAHTAAKMSARHAAWAGLGIADFDRMSVLLSELARFDHEIEFL